MGWIAVSDIVPEPFKTVLTQHEDDLFPVCAFRVPNEREPDEWRREIEGPEDTYDGRTGRHDPLYRAPTHWRPCPIGPEKEQSQC